MQLQQVINREDRVGVTDCVRYPDPISSDRYESYCTGHISFAELDASLQGWINHVRFADSWGLRKRMLAPFFIQPGNIHK